MAIHYFYLKECIDNKDVVVMNCPIGTMLEDCFTKPLQGLLFFQMRDRLMNLDMNDKYHSSHRSVLGNKQGPTRTVNPKITEDNQNGNNPEFMVFNAGENLPTSSLNVQGSSGVGSGSSSTV